MAYTINDTFYQQILNGTQNSSLFEILNDEELLYDVPVSVIVILSLFYGTISLLSVIGNTLVIWIVFSTKQMQTVTNLFIANLAMADVIISVFAIPFQFQAALLQRWNLPEFMCPFCPFVQIVSVNVSVFTLTAIAVDRHRAILNPLRARPSKHISKLVIASVWIISLILASPIAISLRVLHLQQLASDETNHTVYTKPFCENVNLSHSQMRMYRYVLVFMQYFIPVCVISFVYMQMAVRLWGSKTPGNAQCGRDLTLLKNKKKVIKMLVIVVALFGFCWLPLQTYNILQVTWPSINEYRFINIIFFCCDWLAMSNSCYNPFIYGIYNEKFKREFRRRFPFCRSGFEINEYGDKTISMFTRVSSIHSNYASSCNRNRNTSVLQTHNKCRNYASSGFSTDRNITSFVNTSNAAENSSRKKLLYQPVNTSSPANLIIFKTVDKNAQSQIEQL